MSLSWSMAFVLEMANQRDLNESNLRRSPISDHLALAACTYLFCPPLVRGFYSLSTSDWVPRYTLKVPLLAVAMTRSNCGQLTERHANCIYYNIFISITAGQSPLVLVV